MQKGKSLIKKITLAAFVVLALLVAVYHELVLYGLRQGIGQAKILWYAKPVEAFIEDKDFPDSLKSKLHLIAEVRKFAIDSLGLNDTDVYKKMYDQKGKPVMWVVQACEPFKLQSVKWIFPLIGAVPYKGFFEEARAVKLRDELEAKGFDVMVRNPGGWSTLGWFDDPILSNMLKRSEGDLASLIIHEMVHTTVFIKDSIDFNENLANFIGDWGAGEFLKHKFGTDSREFNEYFYEDDDYTLFAQHMLRGTMVLDSLYKQFTSNHTDEYKRTMKKETIRKIVLTLDTLPLRLVDKPSQRFSKHLPNNAYFMSFVHYEAKQNFFKEECDSKFNGYLKQYLVYLKGKYRVN
jgi:predicted aminopeptidase